MRDLVGSYKSQFSDAQKLVLFHEEHQVLLAGRQRGVELTQGDVISCVDNGDALGEE